MKLHRLHVENYKSISTRTLELPDTGLVIVEGLNEVGKTSMVEALDLLLDPRRKATSKAADIRQAQPYGTSLPVLVEAEMTIGGVRLVHSKQFLTQPQARLEFVSGPRRGEVLVDEEATNEMAKIWEGTDQTLWAALRLMQASSLEALSLKSSSALTEALDRASRTEAEGDDSQAPGLSDTLLSEDVPLLDLVEQEYRKYWTATGQPVKTTRDSDGEFLQVQSLLAEAEHKLAEINQVVEELETTEEDLRLQKRSCDELKAQAKLDSQTLRELEELEFDVARTQRIRDDAIVRGDLAKTALKTRDELLSEHRRMTTEVAASTEQADRARTAVDECEAKYVEADRVWKECEHACALAKQSWDRAREQVARVRDKENFVQLNDTTERLLAVQSQLRVAEAHLEASSVTPEALHAAEQAESQLAAAQTKLEVASPRMRVARLSEEAPELTIYSQPIQEELTHRHNDGEHFLDRAIDRTTVVDIADAWRITLTPASDADKLVEEVQQSRRALDDALARMHADSVQQARDLLAQRVLDQNAVDRLSEQLDHELDIACHKYLVDRCASPDALSAAKTTLDDLVKLRDEHMARAAELDNDDSNLTVDQACHLCDAREEEHRSAELAEKTAQRTRELFSQQRTEARESLSAASSRLRSAQEQLDNLSSRMESARDSAGDADLALAAQQAVQAIDEAEAAFAEAEKRLNERCPDDVRNAATASQSRLSKADARLMKTQTTKAELTGQLKGLDRSGSQEAYDELVGRAHRLSIESQALHKRADAAKLLHETLTRHRDNQRQRYLEPFSREVVKLGKSIFGADMEVRVDDSLTVTQRRLAGNWLSWDQLSTGAKEQLGLVVRLATAQLVNADDSVPMILDDALVYSDRVRSNRMLKELASGSHSHQVLVFTSAPERYDALDAVEVQFH